MAGGKARLVSRRMAAQALVDAGLRAGLSPPPPPAAAAASPSSSFSLLRFPAEARGGSK